MKCTKKKKNCLKIHNDIQVDIFRKFPLLILLLKYLNYLSTKAVCTVISRFFSNCLIKSVNKKNFLNIINLYQM